MEPFGCLPTVRATGSITLPELRRARVHEGLLQTRTRALSCRSASAAALSLSDDVRHVTRSGPVDTSSLTGGVARQRRAGRGVGADHLADGHGVARRGGRRHLEAGLRRASRRPRSGPGRRRRAPAPSGSRATATVTVGAPACGRASPPGRRGRIRAEHGARWLVAVLLDELGRPGSTCARIACALSRVWPTTSGIVMVALLTGSVMGPPFATLRPSSGSWREHQVGCLVGWPRRRCARHLEARGLEPGLGLVVREPGPRSGRRASAVGCRRRRGRTARAARR